MSPAGRAGLTVTPGPPCFRCREESCPTGTPAERAVPTVTRGESRPTGPSPLSPSKERVPTVTRAGRPGQLSPSEEARPHQRTGQRWSRSLTQRPVDAGRSTRSPPLDPHPTPLRSPSATTLAPRRDNLASKPTRVARRPCRLYFTRPEPKRKAKRVRFLKFEPSFMLNSTKIYALRQLVSFHCTEIPV